MRLTQLPPPAPPSISCETAVRRLWDFVDAGLPAGERAEVEAHLRACEWCPPHFAFARVVRGALAASRGVSSPGALRVRVLAALRRAGNPPSPP